MRRRGWRRRAAGWALALLAVCAAGWVGLERLRPPLLIRVTARSSTRRCRPSRRQEDSHGVLIYHTHTYEAYQATETENYKPTEKWRTRDENHNMIAVGDALARALTARVIVVHDTTAFEPPMLSTAYKRSLAMLRTRLDAGERYDYWLDVHRDAYSESYRGANGVETEGGSAARVHAAGGQGHGHDGIRL